MFFPSNSFSGAYKGENNQMSKNVPHPKQALEGHIFPCSQLNTVIKKDIIRLIVENDHLSGENELHICLALF